MVYSNKFVMAVLRNGKPQKELANGVVKIPFGEYALRFRNKNNRRALVKFFIDGENVSGQGYIVPANSHLDIERHHDTPTKFKFVSLDSEEAVDFGKNGPNEDKVKGTIEARFYLEKEYSLSTCIPSTEVHHHHHHYPKSHPWYAPNPIWLTDNSSHSNNPCQGPTITCGDNSYTMGTCSTNSMFASGPDRMYRRKITSEAEKQVAMESLKLDILINNPAMMGVSLNNVDPVQDGCTVEGSYSNQTFRTVQFEAETDYVAVKVFLQGYDPERKGIEIKSSNSHHIVLNDEKKPPVEDEILQKIKELEAENDRLTQLAEEKARKEFNKEILRKLEEENRKLRESLGF